MPEVRGRALGLLAQDFAEGGVIAGVASVGLFRAERWVFVLGIGRLRQPSLVRPTATG